MKRAYRVYRGGFAWEMWRNGSSDMKQRLKICWRWVDRRSGSARIKPVRYLLIWWFTLYQRKILSFNFDLFMIVTPLILCFSCCFCSILFTWKITYIQFSRDFRMIMKIRTNAKSSIHGKQLFNSIEKKHGIKHKTNEAAEISDYRPEWGSSR